MFNRIFRGAGGQGQCRGKGGGSKPGAGPAGNCICPKCGYREAHIVSERCIDQTCPKCGTRLVRE
jgi:hypothetical protein